MLQCWGWICTWQNKLLCDLVMQHQKLSYLVSLLSFVKKGCQNQQKNMQLIVVNLLKNGPFHNHLRWGTISHSPGSGSSESHPQFNLNWIFVSFSHFGTWHYKFKMVVERWDKPSPSGKTVKPSKTGCENPFLCFCTSWTISYTHIYSYSTTHCHTAYKYTANSVKHYLYESISYIFTVLFNLLLLLFFITIPLSFGCCDEECSLFWFWKTLKESTK